MTLSNAWRKLPVSLQALLLQLGALPLSLLLLVAISALLVPKIPELLLLAVLQGGAAALLSRYAGLPRWWWPIQLCFWPLLYLGLDSPTLLAVAPFVFLALLLVFGNVVRERVPLFLSSNKVEAHLVKLIASFDCPRVLDLGCGTGKLIHRLQLTLPAARVEGIESAFIPWCIALLTGKLGRSPAKVRYGDLWALDLSHYDVVYAYLSPEPMEKLWRKVKQEMAPGSVFISNTFSVPGAQPDQVDVVPDWNDSTLYIWRIPYGQSPS